MIPFATLKTTGTLFGPVQSVDCVACLRGHLHHEIREKVNLKIDRSSKRDSMVRAGELAHGMTMEA